MQLCESATGLLRQVAELQDHEVIPNDAPLSLAIARRCGAAWSEEIAGIPMSRRRRRAVTVRRGDRVTTSYLPAFGSADDDARRDALMCRLRRLGGLGLVEYATVAGDGHWFAELEDLAEVLSIALPQLAAMSFFVRLTAEGRRQVSSAGAKGGQDEEAEGAVEATLTPAEWGVLEELAAAPHTLTAIEISGRGAPQGRHAVANALRRLADLHLVHWPNGERMGAALTEDGRRHYEAKKNLHRSTDST